jgi:F420-dependent oxidoreductase-like protein
MRYGMSLRSNVRTLDGFVRTIGRYEDAGVDTVWCSQLFGLDTLTLFSVAGATTTRIEFGTAVIPTYARHPLVLASQALTAQAATGNRLILGIGSSHRDLVEGVLGADYERPAAYLREYLSVLPDLLRGERTHFAGERVHVDSTKVFGRACVEGADVPPLLVGTMFPVSLRVAGQLADGTVTWLVGPRTLDDVVIPTICHAASEAARPRPKVVASIPIALCTASDIDRQMRLIDDQLANFVRLPVYQQVLDREGARGPSALAAVGDESELQARLDQFADLGVDEVFGVCFGDDDTLDRTVSFLGQLANDRRNCHA